MKKSVLLLLAIMGGGLLVALGIFLLGRSLNTAANSISNGLSAINANAGTKLSGEIGLNTVGQEDKNDKKSDDKKETINPNPTYRYNSRNISLIKQVLKEDAMTFRKAIGDSTEELMGLKWLLPALEEPEREQ